jgi:addiction module RelB/DinJ family antitoxin
MKNLTPSTGMGKAIGFAARASTAHAFAVQRRKPRAVLRALFLFILRPHGVDICGRFVYTISREVIAMSNTRSTGMHIRVNPEIKASVEPILTAIGLSFSDVFNLTLRQIYLKRRIPFELSAVELTENGYTPEFEAALLAEAEEMYKAVANGTAKVYKNAAELFADMDAEGDDDD